MLNSPIEVEPEVSETGRPPRSSKVLIGASLCTTARMLDTKIVLLKATTFCRSSVLVAGPQTMSMVPFSISGIWVESWIGCSLICSAGSLSSAFTASTIRAQRSIAKPTGCWLSSR